MGDQPKKEAKAEKFVRCTRRARAEGMPENSATRTHQRPTRAAPQMRYCDRMHVIQVCIKGRAGHKF